LEKQKNNESFFKKGIKKILKKNGVVFNFIRVLVRKRRYKKVNKTLPFYDYATAQIKGGQLPEL